MGKHVSNLIEINPGEKIVSAIPIYSFDTDTNIVIASQNGMIKRSKVSVLIKLGIQTS